MRVFKIVWLYWTIQSSKRVYEMVGCYEEAIIKGIGRGMRETDIIKQKVKKCQ